EPGRGAERAEQLDRILHARRIVARRGHARPNVAILVKRNRVSQPPNRPQTVGELLELITPRAWVTPALTALIVIGFGVEVALGASPFEPTTGQLLKVGAEFGPLVVEGQWWRLFTAMFLHGGIVHLAFNLWAFWSAGKLTERIFGNAAFFAIYLTS